MNGAATGSSHWRNRYRRALAQVTVLESCALGSGIMAIILFGLLARAVMHQQMMGFNRRVLTDIHRYSTPTLDSIALAITWLGSVEAVLLIGLALGLWLRRSGRRIDAWVLGAVLIGGGILSVTLKAVFEQTRPEVFAPLYHASGLSFPSGHSLISYCLWGFVATWLVAVNPRDPLRWLGAALSLTIATAVAFSRMYIGVHWPSDIAAGMLVAAFWLATCFIGRQAVRRRLSHGVVRATEC